MTWHFRSTTCAEFHSESHVHLCPVVMDQAPPPFAEKASIVAFAPVSFAYIYIYIYPCLPYKGMCTFDPPGSQAETRTFSGSAVLEEVQQTSVSVGERGSQELWKC